MWQFWGCQRFKSRASQVALTKAAITVTISLKGTVLPASETMRKWAPQTRNALWRNTTNIMKIWFIYFIF